LADDDLEMIHARRRPHTRFGFAMQLCALRYPGRLPAPGEISPEAVMRFVAAQLGLRPDDLAGPPSAPDLPRHPDIKLLAERCRGLFRQTHPPATRLRVSPPVNAMRTVPLSKAVCFVMSHGDASLLRQVAVKEASPDRLMS